MVTEQRVHLIVDKREPLHISAFLEALGADVTRQVVEPGDYIVAKDCAVERKTVTDFINSLFQGRLLDQLEALSHHYGTPFLLVEGDLHLLDLRRNPRSFWGALFKAELEHGVHVVVTSDAQQSADAIYTLAKRLQTKGESSPQARRRPRVPSLSEWQLYVVEGLPGIGPRTADRLLARFRSLRPVFTATIEELCEVEGIGPTRARRIQTLLEALYNPEATDQMPWTVGE